MIHEQIPYFGGEPTMFYAYCDCGVCSRLRVRREDAQRDDEAHGEVCSLHHRRAAA